MALLTITFLQDIGFVVLEEQIVVVLGIKLLLKQLLVETLVHHL